MDRTTLSIWPPQNIFQGRMTSAPCHVLLLLALRCLNVFRQVGWAVDCVFLHCFNVFRQVACAVDCVYYKYRTCSINISLQLNSLKWLHLAKTTPHHNSIFDYNWTHWSHFAAAHQNSLFLFPFPPPNLSYLPTSPSHTKYPVERTLLIVDYY